MGRGFTGKGGWVRIPRKSLPLLRETSPSGSRGNRSHPSSAPRTPPTSFRGGRLPINARRFPGRGHSEPDRCSRDMFKLLFTFSGVLQTLFGFLGRRQKVYFVSTDVARLFDETPRYAESISNCRMGEVWPECPHAFAEAGVIERSALVNLLRHRMMADMQSMVADEIFDCLEYSNLRCAGRDGTSLWLQECNLGEGKPFDDWIEDLKD